MNDSLPEVAETIEDAALQVLTHSFSVYRVEADTAAKIRAAYRMAVGFFHETTIATTRATSDNTNFFLERYRSVKQGNLYGYNVPLRSKELFRTWYDSDWCSHETDSNRNSDMELEEQELEHFRIQQPWPSNEFCEASFVLAKDLHRLLLGCLKQIRALHGNFSPNNRLEENETSENDDVPVRQPPQNQRLDRRHNSSFPPPKKRLRVSLDCNSAPFDSKCDNVIGTNDDDLVGGNKTRSLCPSIRPTLCPMDFFFYHNRIPNAINCSEHVDRGALIVVCLTEVPGLEVRSSASRTQSFQCPEVFLHNRALYRERIEDLCCPGIVCIMAGDQLIRFLSSEQKATAPSACVHRVRNPLKRARLSISYELRLDNL